MGSLLCTICVVRQSIIAFVDCSVQTIVETEGWVSFRAIEARVLQEVLAQPETDSPRLIACGGGCIETPDVRGLLKVSVVLLIILYCSNYRIHCVARGLSRTAVIQLYGFAATLTTLRQHCVPVVPVVTAPAHDRCILMV